MKTNELTGFIYVQVPHQRDPKAYAFATDAEFAAWLESAVPSGFSYRTFTRAEWNDYVIEGGNEPGDDDWNQWDKPGFDLFDAGADSIVQLWRHESSRELMPASEAPDKISCMMNAIDDFHTHYIVDADLWKAIEAGNLTGIQTHQKHATAGVIRDAAESLGWVA